MAVDLSPYVTATSLMGTKKDSWVTGDDISRLAAYDVFESIFRNVKDSFKLVQRGDEANPIYLPTPMTIIEATNRFLAKSWTYAVSPTLGSDGERAALSLYLDNLFRREQLWSKFATQKRYGLVRGDAVWHLVADEEKDAGKRLSIYESDPRSYFPIENPEDADKPPIGCHLVTQLTLDAGGTVARRQTYRKTETGGVSYEVTFWESDGWDDRDPDAKLKPAKSIPDDQESVPVTELDGRITALPVYHVKNNRIPGQPFGLSELAGFETVLGGINQAITDEDLALAYSGLGLYFTTSGPPVDDDGKETNWRFGPGWVLEGDEDSDFKRVNGVTSVTPALDHIRKLETSLREASGVPDIAIGSVDVSTAESGIALAFKMGPILAKNAEKEVEILSVMDHLLYDIVTMWLPVYEGITTAARAVSIVDDPMPLDRSATLTEITQMLAAGLISIAYAQQVIAEKLGYDFPDEMLTDIVNEQAALAKARNYDPFASRAEEELNGGA